MLAVGLGSMGGCRVGKIFGGTHYGFSWVGLEGQGVCGVIKEQDTTLNLSESTLLLKRGLTHRMTSR